MKTVGEFKKAGLELVEGDTYINGFQLNSNGASLVNKLSHDNEIIIKSFAWRENTGVKPEFNGLIDVVTANKCEYQRLSPDSAALEFEDDRFDCYVIKWRPSLNQPQQWPDNSRMDIIGQNDNDGLHYDNTAQQVEALAVNHALLQSRNPESSVKITIKNKTPHSTGSIEPVYDGSFSVCFKSSEVDGRPIFTQVMADNGELPPVGSLVDVIGRNGVELFYGEGEVNCEVLSHVENTAVIKMSYGLGCFSSDALKTSDTRTDREKAIDAAMKASGKAASGLCGFEDMFGKLYDAGYLKC